jgi:hypothetical protein
VDKPTLSIPATSENVVPKKSVNIVAKNKQKGKPA